MTEPKWLVLTDALPDPTDGVRRIPGNKLHVAVRHILWYTADTADAAREDDRGGVGSTIALALSITLVSPVVSDSRMAIIRCLEPVETIQAWLAGKPAPAPPPKRVKVIYPIEALYGRSFAVAVQAILRFDPTATGVQGPGTEELTVECEERHRAVIDELFKPPPGAPPKPLDGEKQGS